MAIDTVAALNDDQIVNQYAIFFPAGIPGTTVDTTILTLRQDQTFPWPNREVGTYDTFYQGQKIPRTSMLEATDKSFTINFRIDSNWVVFNAFNAWFTRCYDDFLGTGDTETNTRKPMVVRAMGPLKAIAKTATFQGVKMKAIKITDFDHSQGEPARCECQFIYYYVQFT